MTLIDDVKTICDRLTPLGWRDLLLAVTQGTLDVRQTSSADLQAALEAEIPTIDRTLPGFEDFHATGARGITAGKPSQSLLYHALASPRVVRGRNGLLLAGFPTPVEIETVENFVFGIKTPTLASLLKASGTSKLAVVVFATEYRPASDCADGPNADLAFSRTGIARIGTARPKYLPDVRGYWPEDEDNPHAFRVVPVRFTAWLAAPVKGNKARVMRLGKPDSKENGRTFWIPVHKLFDGPECLQGFDLSLAGSSKFFNMKLQRVQMSLDQSDVRTHFPYVIEEGLADLREHSEFGRIAVVPVVQENLVEPAILDGKHLTYSVPVGRDDGFATYTTPFREQNGAEIHPFPAYVHARTKVDNGTVIDLNNEVDVKAVVEQGGYNALLYMDRTGEGWVGVRVPQLAGQKNLEEHTRPAYVLLSAPDFFPSSGQRELSRWANSEEIPASFRGGQIWGVAPESLNEIRLPANLQLPDSPFDPKEDTITAVIGMGPGGSPSAVARSLDTVRASTLPDDGAGVFAPGWDAAVDVKEGSGGAVAHLASYGLGSPFPEDAKLCAALSTFWPAVSPDVYRTMSPHTGNRNLRGTVAPLTDEEIGQIGSLPWDGVPGPRVVHDGGQDFVEMASFLHVDYVTNAVENRFSNRLTSRIGAEEYQRRVLAAARVHWVLSGGTNVRPTRAQWLFLSFRSVLPGDPELQTAQNQAGHILKGPVYRVETSFVGSGDPTSPSPHNPRMRRMPLRRSNFFFASAQDVFALRRRETNAQWGRVRTE
jgi:hypothetical protein